METAADFLKNLFEKCKLIFLNKHSICRNFEASTCPLILYYVDLNVQIFISNAWIQLAFRDAVASDVIATLVFVLLLIQSTVNISLWHRARC